MRQRQLLPLDWNLIPHCQYLLQVLIFAGTAGPGVEVALDDGVAVAAALDAGAVVGAG